MEQRLAKHLQMCKMNEKRYKKLIKIINGMLDSCETSEDLLTKFAKKCYGQEEDRDVAKLNAKTFMEALFGGIDTIMSVGPESAVEMMLNQAYTSASDAVPRGKLIKVEKIKRADSQNFSAHLHEPEDEKSMETHPMWTRKLMHYLIGPTLGVGGTAKVKLAWNPKTKEKVAMKILQPKYAYSAEKEINILKKLKHKNIVRVYDCFDNVLWDGRTTTVFAIEYANQGELIEYLMYTSKFEDELARWFFSSLTEGMEYCHSQNVIHRDLKHDNCLLGENFDLKITDFGFATHYYDELMKTAIGTAQYAAPEILAGKKYTDAVDIFSMGVMLFIALAGSQPWRKADHKSDRWYKMVHAGKWDDFFKYHERSHKFSNDQKTVLKGVLEPNPKERWSLRDIQRCKWYKGKKIVQEDVALRFSKRKRTVDMKKFQTMRPGVKVNRKAVDIFSKRLPYVFFQPPPALSFVTDKKAEWALEDVYNVICDTLKGKVTSSDEDAADKYKISFYVNKMVDTGRYIDKKNKVKDYEKVRVNASLQMWTLPGQKETLEARDKVLAAAAANKDTMTKEQKADLSKTIPKIKSIAIFRAEGGGETKYHFPQIYSDILENLPAEVISKDFDNDDVKE